MSKLSRLVSLHLTEPFAAACLTLLPQTHKASRPLSTLRPRRRLRWLRIGSRRKRKGQRHLSQSGTADPIFLHMYIRMDLSRWISLFSTADCMVCAWSLFSRRRRAQWSNSGSNLNTGGHPEPRAPVRPNAATRAPFAESSRHPKLAHVKQGSR